MVPNMVPYVNAFMDLTVIQHGIVQIIPVNTINWQQPITRLIESHSTG